MSDQPGQRKRARIMTVRRFYSATDKDLEVTKVFDNCRRGAVRGKFLNEAIWPPGLPE